MMQKNIVFDGTLKVKKEIRTPWMECILHTMLLVDCYLGTASDNIKYGKEDAFMLCSFFVCKLFVYALSFSHFAIVNQITKFLHLQCLYRIITVTGIQCCKALLTATFNTTYKGVLRLRKRGQRCRAFHDITPSLSYSTIRRGQT